jgi:UDP-N-acetylglucosamine 2-epimerase (non-hydrolysing)
MLDQVLELFDIKPDIDLDLMEAGQMPASFAAQAIVNLTEVLERVRPDVVLVQGDTTTAMVGGLAAFYQKIPVGHVEAGLRTRLRYRPFPEEMNRRVLGVLACFHFAPTEGAAKALRCEGVPEDAIFVTGNPVIDALRWISARKPSHEAEQFLDKLGLDADGHSGKALRTFLVTAHRRESFGGPLEGVCTALRALVRRNPDLQVIYPVHLNPKVRKPVFDLLAGEPRIHLTEPLPYEMLVHLMARSYAVLTDSGGLQEEAPALGKPVLVLRSETERPEGVAAGVAKLVGTDPGVIIDEAERLLRDENLYRRMACAVDLYGDGNAARRIVDVLRRNFEHGARLCES